MTSARQKLAGLLAVVVFATLTIFSAAGPAGAGITMVGAACAASDGGTHNIEVARENLRLACNLGFEVDDASITCTWNETGWTCTYNGKITIEDDGAAEFAVQQMLGALESYGAANRTFVVEGAGFKGRGTGYAFWQGANYATSISSVLIADGHLDADLIPDPYVDGDTSGTDDVLVYHCDGRVAVFALNTIAEPSDEDSAWWTENGCARHPIDNLGINYFKISRPPLPVHADQAELAVDVMVGALESYAHANGSYVVEGAGFKGSGNGYAFWQGANYATSISSVLIADGHLAADAIADPYASGDTSGTGDVMVYHCEGRVGVFTSDSSADPSADDSGWWAANGCNRYAIDNLNATYFKLSE